MRYGHLAAMVAMTDSTTTSATSTPASDFRADGGTTSASSRAFQTRTTSESGWADATAPSAARKGSGSLRKRASSASGSSSRRAISSTRIGSTFGAGLPHPSLTLGTRAGSIVPRRPGPQEA